MKKKSVQKTPAVKRIESSNALVDIGAEYVSRDLSVWRKTPQEKKLLKKMKSSLVYDISGKAIKPYREIPVYDNIIIYLKKAINICDKKYTTLSIHCGQGDIPQILRRHAGQIVKYRWVGKEYAPNELPFWGKYV